MDVHIIGTSESKKFSLFSFIATLCMVLYHAQWDYLSNDRAFTLYFGRFYDFLGCIGMAYFFATTGYLLYHNLTRENGKKKIYGRLKSLLIPFLCWNFIYMFGNFFALKEPVGDWRNILLHFSFTPYDGPLWYVFAILLLLVLMPLCLKLKKKKIGGFLMLFVALFIGITIDGFNVLKTFGMNEESLAYIWIIRFARYMPAYFTGVFFGLYEPDAISRSLSGKIQKIVCSLLVVVPVIVVVFPAIFKWLKPLVIMLMPVALWAVVSNDHFRDEIKIKHKNSFLMYATHFMLIFVLRFVVQKVIPEGRYGTTVEAIVWIILPFFMTAVIYVSCMIAEIVLKKIKADWLLHLLTGNRT